MFMLITASLELLYPQTRPLDLVLTLERGAYSIEDLVYGIGFPCVQNFAQPKRLQDLTEWER